MGNLLGKQYNEATRYAEQAYKIYKALKNPAMAGMAILTVAYAHLGKDKQRDAGVAAKEAQALFIKAGQGPIEQASNVANWTFQQTLPQTNGYDQLLWQRSACSIGFFGKTLA